MVTSIRQNFFNSWHLTLDTNLHYKVNKQISLDLSKILYVLKIPHVIMSSNALEKLSILRVFWWLLKQLEIALCLQHNNLMSALENNCTFPFSLLSKYYVSEELRVGFHLWYSTAIPPPCTLCNFCIMGRPREVAICWTFLSNSGGK